MNAPAVDIESSKNLMLTHAKACYPYEACGLIAAKGNKQEVICGRNIAEDPRHAFCIHPDDYGIAEDTGEILAIYHSHCDESPEPTDADKRTSEHNGVPIITIGLTRSSDGWEQEQWNIYKPMGWKPDLIGRPFVWGTFDCNTLVKDFFAEKLNIQLPPLVYPPDFAHNIKSPDGTIVREARDLFGENLPKAGFVRVSEITIYDLILMQCSADVPNHCAIYLGDGMMIHHAPGHLSGTHPYMCERGYYALCTVGLYRHKELIK